MKTKRLIAILVMLAMVLTLALAACGPTESTHECDNKCSLGHCLTTDCTHAECVANRCPTGGDHHEACTNYCTECGGCLTDDCGHAVCEDKCEYNGEHPAYTGTGTESDPYVIHKAAGLETLATNVNAGTWTSVYVELGADIDLESIADWTPIGNATNAFTGSFDGKYHTISNLTITTGHDYTGLFGNVGINSSIANLKIVGADIEYTAAHSGTNMGAGILAGKVGASANNNTYINNISVDSTSSITVTNGVASAFYAVGGIVGYLQCSNVTACHFSGTLTVSTSSTQDQCIGGIVGRYQGAAGAGVFANIMDGSISVTNNVTNATRCYTGGIVGYGKGNSNSYISFNFYTGSIEVTSSNKQYVAGILAYEDTVFVQRNKSTGTISAAGCTVATVCSCCMEKTPSNNHTLEGYTPTGTLADDEDDNGEPDTHEISWFYSQSNINGVFSGFPSANYETYHITNPTEYFTYSETALPTLAWESAE